MSSTAPSENHTRTRSGALRSLAALAVFFFVSANLLAPRTIVGSEPPPIAGGVAGLEALEGAFQTVVDHVTPSVVGIRAERRQVTALPSAGERNTATVLEQRVLVNGSGAVVHESGLIVTNEHVVHGAADILVLLHDGTEIPATVLQSDARSDLAVLRIKRTGLKPVSYCDWSNVARGQWSVVVGNPFGLGSDGQLCVAVGIVSNLGRQLPGLGEVDDRFYHNMIQTTAPINPGHSGGPLFNVHGELIGIVTAMHTRAPSDEGIGFAIAMTQAKRRLIETLCRGERIEYGYVGLTVRMPDEEEREQLGLSGGFGVIVDKIEPGGPGAAAGIQPGDAIRSFDHQPVTGPAQMAELVGESPPGLSIQIDLVHDGQPRIVELTISRREINRVNWMRGNAVLWRGMRVTDLTADARKTMKVAADACGIVVIDIEGNSPASRAGVQIGDVIQTVAGKPVHDTVEFLLWSHAEQGPLEIRVRDHGRRLILPPEKSVPMRITSAD